MPCPLGAGGSGTTLGPDARNSPKLALGSNHVRSWSEVRETMYPSATNSASHSANQTVLHLTLPVACSPDVVVAVGLSQEIRSRG